ITARHKQYSLCALRRLRSPLPKLAPGLLPKVPPAVPIHVFARPFRQGLARHSRPLSGRFWMDINRFTQLAQEALVAASRNAARAGQQQVDVEHVLFALLEQDNGLAARVLQKAGVNVEALKGRVRQELDRLPKVSGA